MQLETQVVEEGLKAMARPGTDPTVFTYDQLIRAICMCLHLLHHDSIHHLPLYGANPTRGGVLHHFGPGQGGHGGPQGLTAWYPPISRVLNPFPALLSFGSKVGSGRKA